MTDGKPAMPNNRLQPTAYRIRPYLAPAFGSSFGDASLRAPWATGIVNVHGVTERSPDQAAAMPPIIVAHGRSAPYPPDIWECTPPEAQAYIRALEGRVAALEATVQELREQGQQRSRTSSRPPSSDPPHAWGQRPQHGPRLLAFQVHEHGGRRVPPPERERLHSSGGRGRPAARASSPRADPTVAGGSGDACTDSGSHAPGRPRCVAGHAEG
jgi:hypothetical protein